MIERYHLADRFVDHFTAGRLRLEKICFAGKTSSRNRASTLELHLKALPRCDNDLQYAVAKYRGPYHGAVKAVFLQTRAQALKLIVQSFLVIPVPAPILRASVISFPSPGRRISLMMSGAPVSTCAINRIS